ncbi:MAG TPA: hypothetical protein VHQ24_08555 [Lachnospiraceae bacterium]|nr:hypothetical protein [Lachnospiraceae bacterium]
MKKLTRIVSLLLILVMAFTGCSKKESKESASTQFSDPKKGDTVAEIVVKDYGSIFIRLKCQFMNYLLYICLVD